MERWNKDMNRYRYDICFSTDVWAKESAIAAVHDIAGRTLYGYTIFEGHGGWAGTTEPSYTLTSIQFEDDAAIDAIAEDIKMTFSQECVLVVKTLVKSKLV